jgi:hypothetical protein
MARPHDSEKYDLSKAERHDRVKLVKLQIHTEPKVPPAMALLQESLLWTVPWAHHVILIEKIKDMSTRRWYMEQTLANGWSRNILALQIDAQARCASSPLKGGVISRRERGILRRNSGDGF